MTDQGGLPKSELEDGNHSLQQACEPSSRRPKEEPTYELRTLLGMSGLKLALLILLAVERIFMPSSIIGIGSVCNGSLGSTTSSTVAGF